MGFTSIYRGYKIVLRGDQFEVYKDSGLKGRFDDLEDAQGWIDGQWAKKVAHNARNLEAALRDGRAS